jgi:hypothetical protein
MNCPICQQPCQRYLERHDSIYRFVCYCSQKESPNFICEKFGSNLKVSSMYIHCSKAHLEYLGENYVGGGGWTVYTFPYHIIANGHGEISPEEALITVKRFQNLAIFS